MLISARALTASRIKGGIDNAFEVDPCAKVAIAAHSSTYATVTFRPMAIQSYSAYFEAIPDSSKGKTLSFELFGEGNLPQITVVRPILRNSKGHCCMLFKRLSLQNHQTQILTLKNSGTIAATVMLEVTHGASVFDLQCTSGNPLSDEECEMSSPSPTPHPCGPVTLRLAVGEVYDCPIKFTPLVIKKYRGEMWLTIKDNMFERFPVHLVGEGYEDDVSIDNIRGQVEEDTRAMEPEEVPDDVEGTLHFFLLFEIFFPFMQLIL